MSNIYKNELQELKEQTDLVWNRIKETGIENIMDDFISVWNNNCLNISSLENAKQYFKIKE